MLREDNQHRMNETDPVKTLLRYTDETKRQLDELKQDVGMLKEEFAILRKRSDAARCKLLLDSLALSYLTCAGLYVTNSKKKFTTLKELEEALKTEDQKHKWTEFIKNYSFEQCDDILRLLKDGRFKIEQPFDLEDSDECISPKDLLDVVNKIHFGKSEKRDEVVTLIVKQDLLAQQLRRDFLEYM